MESAVRFIIAQGELRDRPVHLKCAFNSGRIPPSKRGAPPRERCSVCGERMNPNEALVLLNFEKIVHLSCDPNSVIEYLEYLHVSPVIQKMEKIVLGLEEARKRYERLREEGYTVVSWICLNCKKPLQNNRKLEGGVHTSCPRIK